MVKNCLYGKSYLFVIRQDFFNPNSDETLLAEDHIECNVAKIF